MKFDDYFLENNSFAMIDEIRQGDHPWSALSKIGDMVGTLFQNQNASIPKYVNDVFHVTSFDPAMLNGMEASITAIQPVMLDESMFLEGMEIYIGKGTQIEPGAMIKGPCYIGENCQIRHSAYLRSGVLTGNRCVIGHCTEVKNSIFMDHSHAGHFNYVGDSILGSHVNLGAGTKLANLQFRTREEIDSDFVNEIVIRNTPEGGQGSIIKTGRTKFGSILGDYTEVGCNTVTAPGSILGANCWVYPNTTVAKDYYKPGSIIKNPGADRCEVTNKPSM